MKLIKQEKINTPIEDQYIWSFDVPENGVCVVAISAKCKSWSQNFRHLFNDDDLAVQIDESFFSDTKGKKREFNTPGSWNGNEVKGNTKTVLFILPIKVGTHRIKFWTDVKPVLEEVKIYKIDENEIELITSSIIASGRFLDIIFKNLKIDKLEIKASTKVGSKLEIKIDGKTQKNPKYKKFEKWFWYGQELKGNSKEYGMLEALDEYPHSLELKGQGEPEIESIKFKINLENIVYSRGIVKLHKDLVIRDDVNLRLDHTDVSESLLMLRDGEKVDIINERVLGKYIENLSEIWHEVIARNNTKGYVLSTYVEIEGQEREKIIDLIKEKSNQYGVDANIMLAIASQESHFKPFAKSSTGPMGVLQLSGDTRKRFGVEDAYDVYQNVAGGVQNYRDIEKRTQVRGDILTKRLVAWHDGPSATIPMINNKTFDYKKLSNRTKNFIKNVLANLEKKDWYHIIYLPIVILFFASSLFISNMQKNWIAQSQEANAINYNVLMNYTPKNNTLKSTSNYFSIFDFRKDESKDYLSYFPNVFFDETNNKVIFLNSEKKIVGKIDPQLLNLDKILGITEDMKMPEWGNTTTHIGSVVLENPENIFYFSAINSYGCGASNCHWALYKFDAKKNNLKLIEEEIFGKITGLYISLDLARIALTYNISESCGSGEYIIIYNTVTFTEQKIEGFADDKYQGHSIISLAWKNNDEIEFQAEYRYDCRAEEFLQITWLYNILQNKLTKIKSQNIEHPMS